jgi:hypothetical protein
MRRGFWLPGLAALLLLSSGAGHAGAANIVVNGGFEAPIVAASQGWDVYPSIPGWSLDASPHDPPYGIEVWRGVNGWLPAEGMQNLELDADTIPPTHVTGNIGVSQALATTAGQLYDISFAFSPRPGVASNVLEFYWDGSLIDTLTADGSSLGQTSWTYHQYLLAATGGSTLIAFKAAGVDDSFGTLLDDVQVTPSAVPEPSSLALAGVCGLVGGIYRWKRRRVPR